MKVEGEHVPISFPSSLGSSSLGLFLGGQDEDRGFMHTRPFCELHGDLGLGRPRWGQEKSKGRSLQLAGAPVQVAGLPIHIFFGFSASSDELLAQPRASGHHGAGGPGRETCT